MKIYYVYIHIRKDNNKIFYVGKGSEEENKKSYARAFSYSHRNKIWRSIVRRFGRKVEIIKVFDNEKESYELEQLLILKLGRLDLKTGTLCNLTAGGDGGNEMSPKNLRIFCEMVRSREWKMKMQKIHGKKCFQYSEDGFFIKEWSNITEASTVLEINLSDISQCLLGRNALIGGYQWKSYKVEKIDKIKTIKERIIEKISKPIIQLDLDGNFIKEWGSTVIAAKQLKFRRTAIVNCLNGWSKKSYNYRWEYKKVA